MKPLTIVKIGGNVIASQNALSDFCQKFACIHGNKILIHGGGANASELCRQMGIEPKMIDGRRVTDEATLKTVIMMYAGEVNKTIVAQLQSYGVNGIGMTGADGDIIRAKKRPVLDIDYGYVGDVISVDSAMVSGLLDLKLVPILAPLTHDTKGQLLNTNADTIASVVAVAMAKFYQVKLYYCLELSGVMKNIQDPSTLISRLDSTLYIKMKKEGNISKGMIPKIDNALSAAAQGVYEVRILKADQIDEISNGKDGGTIVTG